MTFMKSMDVIFCCNVLIYFDLASKRRVIQHFYNNLLPHGYLFLGHSESLYGVSDDFRLVHLPGATAYMKGELSLTGGKASYDNRARYQTRCCSDSTDHKNTNRFRGARSITALPSAARRATGRTGGHGYGGSRQVPGSAVPSDGEFAVFGRWQTVDSLRGAVLSLGFRHISDIVMCCSVMNLFPGDKNSLDPVVFWEHSLGCALVCRTYQRSS